MIDSLTPANPGAGISRRAGIVQIDGVAQCWAYAAVAPLGETGTVTVTARLKLRAGTMSMGILTKDRSTFVIERSIPRANDFIDMCFSLDDADICSDVVFRTYDKGDESPVLELQSFVLHQRTREKASAATTHHSLDPVVENLWPLETAIFNVDEMRRWSIADLQKHLTGDAWRDNLILNKFEFAQGVTHLKSFPWRFSVPFVLCNARCEFCSAWLVQGQPMPIDLLHRLDVVLPYLAQIDMVGWGEPLIHPQFGEILARLRDRGDPRARIALTTNGVHLKKWVDQLIEANVKEYAISIHAATPSTHEDLMGLPLGSFNTILEGIRSVTARKVGVAGITLGLVFIVTRQNIAEIPAFITLAHDLKVDSIFIRTLKTRTAEEQRRDGLDYHRLPPYLHPDFENLRAQAIDAINKSSVPVQAAPETWSTRIFPEEVEAAILAEPLTPREVRRASKSLRREPVPDTETLPIGEPLTSENPRPYYADLDYVESDIANDLLDNPYHRRAPLFCPSPYTALYINGFDRMVTPCCYMTRVPGYNYSFLRKGASFEDVWNSPAMVGLRQTLNNGPLKAPCKKCAFYW